MDKISFWKSISNILNNSHRGYHNFTDTIPSMTWNGKNRKVYYIGVCNDTMCDVLFDNLETTISISVDKIADDEFRSLMTCLCNELQAA